MSFADLERGEGGIKRGGIPGPGPLSGIGSQGSINDNNRGHATHNNNNNRWNRGGADNFVDVNQHANQAKVQQISQQVFRISSNVSSVQRLVGFLGTPKDSPDVRTKLQVHAAFIDITEQTRVLVRETSQEIKNLTKFDASG
ncbi:hypothetical protein BG011_000271, partial [Mortierella polycephala]